jgi:23S rRNA pseudouridine1911/1915/1917 synthase
MIGSFSCVKIRFSRPAWGIGDTRDVCRTNRSPINSAGSSRNSSSSSGGKRSTRNGFPGLLAVARTQQAYDALVSQLAARSVGRRYDALVWGSIATDQGVIDAPIGRSSRDPTRMAVVDQGREARTRYQVVERFTDPVEVTLADCALETGRTHQIRVHLSAIEHPVVGDTRYGGARQSLALSRPFLHARHLELTHPVTGESLAFEAPLPDELREVLAHLG